METKDDANCVKACTRLMVEGTVPVGRLRNTWQNTLSADMRLQKVDPRDGHDRKKWRAIGRLKAKPSRVWNKALKPKMMENGERCRHTRMTYFGPDVLCPVGVHERVARLLEVEAGRANVCDHHRLTVASQRVLQETRQLTVTVVDVPRATLVTLSKTTSRR